jgi:hypothetical protein
MEEVRNPSWFTKIEKRYEVDPVTECWNWLLGKTKKGYGRENVEGRNQYAHIISYVKHKGPVPEGKILDHLCRNPGCINPDHLEPVTIAINNRRGLKTKLTPEAVQEIRSMPRFYGWRTLVKEKFGIGNSQITRIITDQQWL